MVKVTVANRGRVRAALAVLGIKLTYNSAYREYRVAYAGPNSEPSAYYTSNLDDAIDTAVAMAQTRSRYSEVEHVLR